MIEDTVSNIKIVGFKLFLEIEINTHLYHVNFTNYYQLCHC
jgi:hypothetical protein